MMFLQYFVQGSYLPVATVYLQDHLNFSGTQMGIFGGAVAFGAVLAPFISGQLADRHFATERFLACTHFLGGIVMLLIAGQADATALLALTFVYSLLYVPTISLTNTMCFRHLTHIEREFPSIRLWGTIGFIFAQWPFEFIVLTPLIGDQTALAAARGYGFTLSGVSGLVMGVYCWTLMPTPPARSAAAQFAPKQAFRLLPNRAFLVAFLASLPIAIVHQYHFVWNAPFLKAAGLPEDWIGRVSSVGQFFEIFVLIFLGYMVTRLGFKATLTIGIMAYLARNAIFAFVGSVPVLIAAQALHGLCFGCFFAVAFMLVDELAPRDARNSVQTFFSIFALGVGASVGGWIAGPIGDYFADPATGVINYTAVWGSAAAIAGVTLLVFLVTFPRRPLPEKGPVTPR
jgi:nucleoside transporter